MSVTRVRKKALVAPSFKPRNPLVPLALARKAGEHRPDRRAQRRQARLALRKGEPD